MGGRGRKWTEGFKVENKWQRTSKNVNKTQLTESNVRLLILKKWNDQNETLFLDLSVQKSTSGFWNMACTHMYAHVQILAVAMVQRDIWPPLLGDCHLVSLQRRGRRRPASSLTSGDPSLHVYFKRVWLEVSLPFPPSWESRVFKKKV